MGALIKRNSAFLCYHKTFIEQFQQIESIVETAQNDDYSYKPEYE